MPGLPMTPTPPSPALLSLEDVRAELLAISGHVTRGSLPTCFGSNALRSSASLFGPVPFTASCSAVLVGMSANPSETGNRLAQHLRRLPDGYRNVATKCSHGHRIYQGTDPAARVNTIIPNDPSCPRT